MHESYLLFTGEFLLKTNIIVNGNEVFLNEFTQNYIGNVLSGIVLSFGYTSDVITAQVDEAGLKLYTEKGEIPLIKEFSKSFVESTIKGMLSPLKGIFWLQNIIITVSSDKS